MTRISVFFLKQHCEKQAQQDEDGRNNHDDKLEKFGSSKAGQTESGSDLGAVKKHRHYDGFVEVFEFNQRRVGIDDIAGSRLVQSKALQEGRPDLK